MIYKPGGALHWAGAASEYVRYGRKIWQSSGVWLVAWFPIFCSTFTLLFLALVRIVRVDGASLFSPLCLCNCCLLCFCQLLKMWLSILFGWLFLLIILLLRSPRVLYSVGWCYFLFLCLPWVVRSRHVHASASWSLFTISWAVFGSKPNSSSVKLLSMALSPPTVISLGSLSVALLVSLSHNGCSSFFCVCNSCLSYCIDVRSALVSIFSCWNPPIFSLICCWVVSV